VKKTHNYNQADFTTKERLSLFLVFMLINTKMVLLCYQRTVPETLICSETCGSISVKTSIAWASKSCTQVTWSFLLVTLVERFSLRVSVLKYIPYRKVFPTSSSKISNLISRNGGTVTRPDVLRKIQFQWLWGVLGYTEHIFLDNDLHVRFEVFTAMTMNMSSSGV
jgi:hypothetical protein